MMKMSNLCLGINLSKTLQVQESSPSLNGRVAGSVFSSRISLSSPHGVLLKKRRHPLPRNGELQLRSRQSQALAVASAPHKKKSPPETLGKALEVTQIAGKKNRRLRANLHGGTIPSKQSQLKHGERYQKLQNRGEDGRQPPRMRRHL